MLFMQNISKLESLKTFEFFSYYSLDFYFKILYSIYHRKWIKSRCVLPLYYIAIAMRKWGGVYGRFFTIPNHRFYDFYNYKHSLINSYIHNLY
jgi:hypothetical protein